ncbi:MULTISPECIES: hypothetical protein [Pseudomonas]|uniref:hypothetical protein n=1 Tax=Pseudomonas TaxID=286 RepID=UPI00070B8124|nr:MULTISPECIES: hypothetical protein [Pseudomonas]KQW33436.1 hypothetical protein ASC85_22320 [Pseudomonas sp. Root401]WHS53228.1 hypothetical protein QLH64_23325 [Pseudomonas brassicacearum]
MDTQSTGSDPTHAPGEIDPSFGKEGSIQFDVRGIATAIVSDEDGKLVFALGLYNRFALMRYLPDGTKDETFNEIVWNFRDGDGSLPTRVLLQEDRKILLIGGSPRGAEWSPAAVRFFSNGGHDLVFGRKVLAGPVNANSGAAWIQKYVDGCLQKDQRILICATYHLLRNEEKPEATLSRLFCLEPNGDPDTGFGEGRGFIDIRFHDYASFACDVQIQSDSKIIVAGSWRRLDEQRRTRTVARYMPTGELDASFGNGGFADIPVEDQIGQSISERGFRPDIVSRVRVLDDDKILITGYAKGLDAMDNGLLVRMEANGGLDGSFNNGAPLLIARELNDLHLNSLAVQPDGKIVVVGRGMMAGKAMQQYERVSPSGEIEGFWRGHSLGDLVDVTIQPSGRVVASGSIETSNMNPSPAVWGYLGS